MDIFMENMEKYGKYGKYGNIWKGFDQLAWLYLSVEGYVTDLHI